ncbi:12735_t:CDS:2 [Ambispora gerdemannii]|uniref:12735_t:CDS:1 n=1 Tax=Ambispora gerdemannii TaxID=144530 RepID=A0A9N9B812_9GLOM|nr:12735_t:CDS:2 [Ambispora gerdemannii]
MCDLVSYIPDILQIINFVVVTIIVKEKGMPWLFLKKKKLIVLLIKLLQSTKFSSPPPENLATLLFQQTKVGITLSDYGIVSTTEFASFVDDNDEMSTTEFAAQAKRPVLSLMTTRNLYQTLIKQGNTAVKNTPRKYQPFCHPGMLSIVMPKRIAEAGSPEKVNVSEDKR